MNELIQEKFDELTSRYIFATYEDTGKILVYSKEEGIYSDATSLITSVSCDSDTLITPRALSTIILNIKGRSYKSRHQYNDSICIGNGILSFENGDFAVKPYTHKMIFESKVNINYDKNAECPIWIKTINSMLPDKNDRLLLQEWFGYHFLPGQKYENAMFITGKPSTGKSTTIYVLNKLLGGCSSHHELADFQDDKQYSIADLYGKYGNTYTDMGNKVISDVGKFKVLTGSNDTVTARFPYERPFNFINPAKLTFASNKLPPLSANVQADLAFWKRVLLLQYSTVVLLKDPMLFEKLNSEMSGILNWSLEGYKRLISNSGQFTKNVDDIYDTWVNSAYSTNPIQDFLDDACILDANCFCECTGLYNFYIVWMKKLNEIPLNPMEFKSSLVQKGIFESRKMNASTGIRERVYKGICLS